MGTYEKAATLAGSSARDGTITVYSAPGLMATFAIPDEGHVGAIRVFCPMADPLSPRPSSGAVRIFEIATHRELN
jgi:hypothetical protein